jgi:hypothetical protein
MGLKKSRLEDRPVAGRSSLVVLPGLPTEILQGSSAESQGVLTPVKLLANIIST